MSSKLIPQSLVTLCTIWALFLLPVAYGQQPKQPQLPKIELRGTVEEVKAGYITLEAETVKVTYDKNDPRAKKKPDEKDKAQKPHKSHTIAIHPQKTRVQVHGKADQKFLKPGQQVSFTGKIDKTGNFVGALEIITVLPPDKNFKPEAKIDFGSVSFVKDVAPLKEKPFDAKAVVLANRRGKLLVLFQNNLRMTIPLDTEAEVRFTVPNYSLAKKGDSINVSGRLFQPGKVFAENVTITLKKPEKKAETTTDKPATK